MPLGQLPSEKKETKIKGREGERGMERERVRKRRKRRKKSNRFFFFFFFSLPIWIIRILLSTSLLKTLLLQLTHR